MAAGSTYTPIATTTLGRAAASYTFSSIPNTYTDLIAVFSGTATAANSVYIRFNGDTANNYSFTYLYGSGSSASSGRTATTGNIYAIDIPTSQTNLLVNVNNYSNTTTFKTSLQRGNAAATAVTATVGLYRSTSAISSLEIYTNSTFTTGSTFTLYGIKAA
jgi:hypothetical protein